MSEAQPTSPTHSMDSPIPSPDSMRETEFHVLSFEGPDAYARAGGIGTRISGLTDGLAAAGFRTHLWFVGDPELPGLEHRGALTLHRWCQWISHFHRGGVYDGEEGKRLDFSASLPPVLHDLLRESAPRRQVIVLAEEWQTADAVLHLDWLLRRSGLRDRVGIFWNANNTFGFDRIDWPRLARAATITTVSRYMRHCMAGCGVDALVMPNGLGADALAQPDRAATAALRTLCAGRVVLTKVARWDPDKRWLLAIDTVGELKRHGWRPLLVARGGVEAHGAEVLRHAAHGGLRVVQRSLPTSGTAGLLDSLKGLHDVDVVSLRSPLTPDAARVLYRASSAILANSAHEPFGLVGLEAMAAGGVACTGNTGEDYVVPGWNALVLQSDDPHEFVSQYRRLQSFPIEERALRRHGRATARRYAWSEVIRRNLLPRLPAPAVA